MARGTRAVFVAWLAAGCAKPLDTGVVLRPSTLGTADPTVCERLLARAREPRLPSGEASAPAVAVSEPFGVRFGRFGADDGSASRDSSLISIGARAAITHACRPRHGRDVRPMLAEVNASRVGRAPGPSEARSAYPPSECSVAPRLARLPLESFRRDRTALWPDCRF